MIATSAKLGGRAGLKELVEAASPGPWTVTPADQRSPSDADFLVHATHGYVARLFWASGQVGGASSLGPPLQQAEINAKLLAAAPALARLVLDLAKALGCETRRNPLHTIGGHAVDRCDNCKALAAVEEL